MEKTYTRSRKKKFNKTQLMYLKQLEAFWTMEARYIAQQLQHS